MLPTIAIMLGIASRSSIGRIGAVSRLAMGEATGARGGAASMGASIVMSTVRNIG
ncbi:hypothetical protein BDS110ZK4_59060 [Bradyrhizobium diazoefficiens]|uniref:Uncharacterized protein n=1 Tax=Bradyrhizobium diazoefficiens TaxID=1355477 RepID=A0A809ZRR8_9BRAD|nr:hypothetical protein H12S4_85580 [Bradyrhizobium diazoefficiens]BCA16320.1 hypothetical protein BDHF08_81670 [Bradyrhizobium diazoefficiens]BCA25007.1 hypothetical protein BDHH15_82220 [Bradyrhizobium diazoefficiens]BCE25742.1 hypothetical protein XF1B_84230 [Bradyrhizobium diazoefficiens]BCE34492.1 hypothetical protein XF2B_82610 [Bradyrhizobium diazoefficiens]